MNSSFVIALSVIGDQIFEVVKLMWKQLPSLALRFSKVSYRSLSDCCCRYSSVYSIAITCKRELFCLFFFFKGIEYSRVGSL